MTTVPYPVRLQGRPDPSLSRWLWLVKWVLVIPHLIVLAFLWAAFAVLGLVAFVSLAGLLGGGFLVVGLLVAGLRRREPDA